MTEPLGEKFYVFDVQGSLVETERGIEDEIVALILTGTAGPGEPERELRLVLTLDPAARMIFGLQTMFTMVGRGHDVVELVEQMLLEDRRNRG